MEFFERTVKIEKKNLSAARPWKRQIRCSILFKVSMEGALDLFQVPTLLPKCTNAPGFHCFMGFIVRHVCQVTYFFGVDSPVGWRASRDAAQIKNLVAGLFENLGLVFFGIAVFIDFDLIASLFELCGSSQGDRCTTCPWRS